MKKPQAKFTDLLIKLFDADVEFVLVGGLAAAAYGSPQVTHDIDICINLSIVNLKRIQVALQDVNPKHRMHPSKPVFDEEGERLAAFNNIYLDTDIGQLDCLGYIKGIGDYGEVLTKIENITIQGRLCKILALPALIQAKAAMNRPKDVESVNILKAIMEQIIDNDEC